MDKLVKLAVDTYQNKLHTNYSKEDSAKVLREALVELNGGNTKLDYKKIRDGKCAGLFSIIEEILNKTIIEGLPDDNFFQQFVESRNLALGDQNSFYVEDPSLLVVSDMSEGNVNIRRQRLNVGESFSVTTGLKGIAIYEELNRILSARVDMNEMIDKVATSFKRKINEEIYTSFAGTFSKLPSTFAVNGSYSEDSLLTLIDHVEAATGQTAMIVGTRPALRKVNTAVVSEEAKKTMNEQGYYGSFNGTPMMMLKNAHIPGGYNFMLPDNELYVVPAGIKPIKFVTEGESIILQGDPMKNADLTVDYLFADRYGISVMIATLFGIYRIA
jgi:hypothetical protein